MAWLMQKCSPAGKNLRTLPVGLMMCLSLSTLFTACVVPQPLDKEEDTVNSTPQVSWESTTPSKGSERVFLREPNAEIAPFSLAIRYSGSATLTVRFFLDHHYESFLHEQTAVRALPDYVTLLVKFSDLCTTHVNYELGVHWLEFYISTSGFDDERGKIAQDFRIINPGGVRENDLWKYKCEEPPPSATDGGL